MKKKYVQVCGKIGRHVKENEMRGIYSTHGETRNACWISVEKPEATKYLWET